MNKWIESASRDLAEQLHAVRQISASLQTTKVQEPSQEKWLGHSPVMDELNFDESKCESAEVRGEPQALTESQARQGPKRQFFSLSDFAERVYGQMDLQEKQVMSCVEHCGKLEHLDRRGF